MYTIDPGHRYRLFHLDGTRSTFLQFVKRVGAKFPGNAPPVSQGTTLQEVYRACLERAMHLQGQAPCDETEGVIKLTIHAIRLLEGRAARLHGRPEPPLREMIEGPFCGACGHAGCKGECGHA